MIILILTIFAILWAYAQCARYVIKEKGTWKRESVRVPIWGGATDRLDSYHSTFGLMVAIAISLGILYVEDVFTYPLIFFDHNLVAFILHGVFYWLWLYWIRNIFMHVLFRTKEYQQIEYLYPSPVRWLIKLFIKKH